jgi:hypothetical protein
VPGNFSATVNVDDFCSIVWALGIFGALASCVDTLMLKQDAGVWPNASRYFLMDGSLEGEPFEIWHEIGIKSCG